MDFIRIWVLPKMIGKQHSPHWRAGLLAEAGFNVITAFISSYRRDRHLARDVAGEHFHEIYLSADLAACEARDPKGLYAKARSGEIADVTGVTAPYQSPKHAELIADAGGGGCRRLPE